MIRQKIDFILHVFLEILQRYLCIGYFGHAWLCTPKVIQSNCRKPLCLSPGKKSTPSPIDDDDVVKTWKLILGTLGMAGYTNSK